MRPLRHFTLTMALCMLVAPKAAAQADDGFWLIVPTTSALTDDWMEPTVTTLRAELLQRGIAVWPPQRAAAEFEQNGSANPAKLTSSQAEAWADQSRSALWSLAQGESSAALDELSRAQELSRRDIEELNRDEARARLVLDTCLYMVRALLETGLGTDAKTLGRECRALVPRGEPTTGMHPASVLEILESAEAERTERPTTLRVTSHPSGCTVRVNGLRLGATPLEVDDLLPAQYRVQVECDPAQRGRVHIADTSAGLAEVFVDTRFDGAIDTEPFLHLRYANKSQEQKHRIADAEKIAETVHATTLVLLSAPSASSVQLELVEGAPLRRRAVARVPAGARGPTRGDVALAVRTLIAGTCTDFTVIPPAALPCGAEAKAPTPNEPPSTRRPRGQLISGLTLVGVGGASLLTSYVLLAPRARAAEDWVAQLDSSEPPDGQAQQRWLDMGSGIVLTSSIGAAALVAAMPLALPNRVKPPWWAWLSGGIGVGLAAFSIAYGVTGDEKPATSCSNLNISSPDAQSCVRHGERTSAAILTGVTAAPLITVPLVYLLRRGDSRLEPSIQVSRRGGFLSIRGRL